MDVPSVSWNANSDGIRYLFQAKEIFSRKGENLLAFNILTAFKVDIELGNYLCIGITKNMLISN
jgi:hypothetical protein